MAINRELYHTLDRATGDDMNRNKLAGHWGLRPQHKQKISRANFCGLEHLERLETFACKGLAHCKDLSGSGLVTSAAEGTHHSSEQASLRNNRAYEQMIDIELQVLPRLLP